MGLFRTDTTPIPDFTAGRNAGAGRGFRNNVEASQPVNGEANAAAQRAYHQNQNMLAVTDRSAIDPPDVQEAARAAAAQRDQVARQAGWSPRVESHADGGQIGAHPSAKKPNPPFTPFGTKPGATPA